MEKNAWIRLLIAGVIGIAAGTAPGRELTVELDALDAAIAQSREAAIRSEATLEELRRDLFDAAVKARDAKRVADAIEQGRLDDAPVDEDEMSQLRQDLIQSGILLRNLRDRLDAIHEIVQANRRNIDNQDRELKEARRRRGVSDAEDIKVLRAQLEKANRTIADYAATISRLRGEQATGAGTPPVVATPTPAPSYRIGAQPLRQGFDALAAGRIDEASEAFKAAIARDPLSDDARIGLASCHFERGELDTARRMVEEVLGRNAEHSGALGLRGALELREGNVRAARRTLEKALKLDETNAYHHNYLGVVHQQMNKHKQALKHVSRAVELDPEYVNALYNLAILQATGRNPDLEAARMHYQRARSLGAPASAALERLLAAP